MPDRVRATVEGIMENESGFGAILGVSERMRELYGQMAEAGPSTAAVLIVGETGTGKELVARTLHQVSPRRRRPYVAVNCAAMPEGLVESELFGHEKGAFTGAIARAPGYFEQAHRGTLFLDELSAMPMSQQSKLLRVLQEGTLRRLGSGIETTVDVRVVAATNVDPARAIADGRLRADLYYRLSVFVLRVPPLRERGSDVLLLAESFARKHAEARGESPKRFEDAAAEALLRYSWPGNVRELRNAIERGVILARGDRIRLEDLPAAIGRSLPAAAKAMSLAPVEDWKEAARPFVPKALPIVPGMTLEEVKRRLILMTLEASGSVNEAARQLGISSRTIYNKIREWKLSPQTPGAAGAVLSGR
jgi:DNA-binding NtrC family response regulator